MLRNTAVRQRAYAKTETRRQGNSEGTQRGYWRPRAITRLRTNPRSCSSFVPATSRPCPPFPPRCSMVRRGSPVRVRKRACKVPANGRFLNSARLHGRHCASGMEPFMELPSPEPGPCHHDRVTRAAGRNLDDGWSALRAGDAAGARHTEVVDPAASHIRRARGSRPRRAGRRSARPRPELPGGGSP